MLMQKGELTNQPWLECLINQDVIAIQLKTVFVLSDNLLHCQQGASHHQLQTNSSICQADILNYLPQLPMADKVQCKCHV